MKVAFIGLPQSGKTTLISAVTGCTPPDDGRPQVHHAVVKVPDPRLKTLAQMYKPRKIVEATIEFIDVPGFSLADRHGQDEFRSQLPEVRQAELLVAVIRSFQNDSVPAYRNRVDAEADLLELREELVYTDLATISNRIEKIEKSLRKPTKTHDAEKRELAVLQKCNTALENSQPLSTVVESDEDRAEVSSFGLLTIKPLLVVINVSEDQAAKPDPTPPPNTVAAINVCAQTELEISRLDQEDRDAFLEDLGVESSARDRLISRCYEALGLISFLTAGPDEVRAWTIPFGSDAVIAAGKIHSDIARGFIRAETVAYDDLIDAGDMKVAKANAKVRQEGKQYVVHDGDVINFKFNV